MHEAEPHRDSFEEMEAVIDAAQAEIEHEFQISGNSWVDCVNRLLVVLPKHIEIAHDDGLLPDDKYEAAKTNLEKVNQRVADLSVEYPDRDSDVPAEVKDEIYKQLNILNGTWV